MTISSTTRLAGPFIGAGSTAVFPFSFKIFEQTDVYVQVLNVMAGTIAILNYLTDYRVSMNFDQDTIPGGSITLTAGNLATGYSLIITTNIPFLQNLELANAGAFYPDVINQALDWLTVMVQQLAVYTNCSIQYPITDSGIPSQLPPVAERAGNILGFDVNGAPTMIAPTPSGHVPGPTTMTGAVNGVNKVFTFTAAAGATPVPMVFVGGIYQDPSTDYGIPVYLSGSTWQLTFTNAPANGPVKTVFFA